MSKSTRLAGQVALLVALAAAALVAPASARGSVVLGSSDGLFASASQLEETASLGARVSRVIVNVDFPLESYDQAIADREAAGMHVQVIIGGIYAGPMPTIAQAVAVQRR